MTAPRGEGFLEEKVDAALAGIARVEAQGAEILALLRAGHGGAAPVPDEPLPTVPPPAPAPALAYPADLFGKGWKVTLPLLSDSGDKAWEVLQPALATYSSPSLELGPDRRSAIFRAHHGAPTTKGSKNPRSELREMTADGLRLRNFSATAGRHTLDVDLAVNRLTRVKPHVVVAQIHGGDDDITVWRVEGSKLWITRGDESHGWLALDGLQLGQRLRLGFTVEGGKVRYRLTGQQIAHELKTTDGACFFKAGCYLQSNPSTAPAEDPAAYAEVEIFSITTTHT